MQSVSDNSLLRLNALLNEAQHLSGIGAWELDVHTGKTFWSEEVYRIYEVPLDFDHNRDSGVQYYALTDQKLIESSLNRAITHGESFTVTCRFIAATGVEKWVKVSGRPDVVAGKSVRVLGVIQDISEIKRKELEVMQSLELSSSLIEFMQDGLSIVSLDGQQLSVNPAFCRITGYEAQELIGHQAPFPYWPAEEIDSILTAFNTEIRDGLTHRLIFSRKNGERFPVIVSPGVLKSATGELKAYFATVKDITDQVRTEEELRQLALVAAKTTDAVVLTDADRRIIWVNSAFVSLTGYTLNEVKGQFPGKMLQGPGTDLQAIRAMNDALNKQKSVGVEVLNYAKDGNAYWLDLNINPVFDDQGQLKYFIAIERDVTEKRRQRELLEESLKEATSVRMMHDAILDKLQKLTNSAPGAIFQVQLDETGNLRFTYVSEGITRVDPRLTPEVLMSSVEDAFLSLVGQEQFDAMLTQMIESAEMLTPVQFVLNLDHGDQSRWVQAHARPEMNEKGEIIWYGYVKDITESREHQLALENMVQLTSDQNNRLLSFTQIVSHNIRSHASNITGLLGLMDISEDHDDRKAYVELLKESAGKLDETLHNLNEVLCIQRDLKLPRRTMNLRREINKVLNSLAFDIKQHFVFIQNDVSPQVSIRIVPAYLESILLNLTTNAIKYRATDRKPHIIYRAHKFEQHLEIEVQDNGRGLDLKKYGKSIFNMYKTFHGNEDAKGLGLFLVKNQIESMQGTISVFSEVGVGTTFRVLIPLE
jgi:PAS domain S-box-containing protein